MTYHLRRADRELIDPSDIDRILCSGRYATFALLFAGEPYVVSLSYGWDAATRRLYFHVAHEGMKLDAIAENPVACGTVVLAGEYSQGECAHPYESVVMRGRFRLVETADEKAHAIRTLVWHLEQDPQTYWDSRSLDDSNRTDGFTALCFEVEFVTGKTGS